MKIVLSCAVLTFAFASAGAQGGSMSPAPRDAADSASVARTLYARVREELSRRDTVAALGSLSQAARAWPLQPAYANALLMLSLRAHDELRATEAIRLANSNGFALPSAADSSAWSQLTSTEGRALLAQQKQLRDERNSSRDFTWLADSTLFPEGVSFDSRSGTMYVSSIYHRNIAVVERSGKQHWLLRNDSPDVGAIFGIAVDTSRNVIWASSAANAAMKAMAPDVRQPSASNDNELATLLAISISDGKVVKRANVPMNVANPSPGDLLLMSNGDVLMSDSQAGVLWWLRSGADSLIGIRNKLLRSPQGIVPSADNKTVWVADYSHGLLRIDLNTQQVDRVADLPGHSTVGIDGLVQFQNTLIAVQNGFSPSQVLQIELNAAGNRVMKQSVIDRSSKAPSPTGGFILNNEFVYIANSLWESLDATGKLDTSAPLPRPLLLRLPLK